MRFDALAGDGGRDGDGSTVPLVQTVQHTSGAVPSSRSVAVPFASRVTAGNVLLVAVSAYEATTISTPIDSQGNVYTLAVTASSPGNAIASIYATTAAQTGPDAVTCSIGIPDNIHCHLYEVSGVTATLDASGTQIQNATANLSVATTASTTTPHGYVLAYFATNNTRLTLAADPRYGDAELTSSPSADTGFSEAKVVEVAEAQVAIATASSPDDFVNLIVAFKGAGN